MSKLLDRLEQIAQPAQRRLGFATSQVETSTPPMALVLRFTDDSKGMVKNAPETADAVIVRANKSNSIKNTIKNTSDLDDAIPWGIHLNQASSGEIEELQKAGCDYLVFGTDDTQASILNHENIGKVLSLGLGLEERFMRILEDIPAEVMLLEVEDKSPLTLKQLMEYRTVLSSVSKPVLVTTPASLSEDDLTSLYNIGMVGIVIDAQTKGDLKQVPRLQKAIESLPPREEDDRGRIGAVLPHSTPSPGAPEFGPDEEDE